MQRCAPVTRARRGPLALSRPKRAGADRCCSGAGWRRRANPGGGTGPERSPSRRDPPAQASCGRPLLLQLPGPWRVRRVEPGCGWAASPFRLAVPAIAYFLTHDRLRLPVYSPPPAMLGCAGPEAPDHGPSALRGRGPCEAPGAAGERSLALARDCVPKSRVTPP